LAKRREVCNVPGSYRQLQARLRTNAEPVAFYGGIEKEGSLIVSKFKELVRHHVKLLNTQWRFAMWQVCSMASLYRGTRLFLAVLLPVPRLWLVTVRMQGFNTGRQAMPCNGCRTSTLSTWRLPWR
jgi:ABC-type uncharacterized transport system fused permease/ATPase subunit